MAFHIPFVSNVWLDDDRRLLGGGRDDVGEQEGLLPRREEVRVAPTSELQSKPCAGVLLAVFASLLYGFMQLFVSYGTQHLALSPVVYLLARGIFGCIAAPAALLVAGVDAIDGKSCCILCIRGLAGAGAMLCKYICLSLLRLSDATAVTFTFPVISVFFGCVFLGESAGLVELLSAIICFIGVVIIASSYGGGGFVSSDASAISERFHGLLFGLGGAVLTSVGYTVARFIGHRLHYQWNVFALALSSVAISLCLLGNSTFAVLQMSTASLPRNFVIAGAAVCSFLSASCTNRALQVVPSGFYAVLRNGDIPIAMFLSAAFLGDRLPQASLVGAVLIFGATLALSLRLKATA
jgi:drug/metabolite transporter (DMT)-like permease